MSRRSPRTWPALAVLCAATVAAYAPSFLVPFQFDDFGRLANNDALQRGEWVAALTWMGNSRLLPSATLIADYRLYGTAPLGYHVINLLAHLGAAAGVYALARVIFRRARLAWSVESEGVFALSAALLFACHPVQVEAVTYIIQRSATMATGFYVWSVVAFLSARLDMRAGRSGRGRRRAAAAVVLALCACLSKENAVTLPLAWLLAEWCFVARPARRAWLIGAAGLVLACAAVIALKGIFWGAAGGAGLPSPDVFLHNIMISLASPAGSVQPWSAVARYALTQATVVPQYLLLIVRPWGLSIDHDVIWHTHFSGAVAAGAAAIAVWAAVGMLMVRRAPPVGFGLLWFLLTLGIESSFLPLPDAMAERRLYLPMAGIALVAASGVVAAWRRIPRLTAATSCGVLTALIGLTFARNLVWQSPLSLWRDAAEKSPGKLRPLVNLGVAHHQVGQLDDAVQAYCAALQIAPNDEVVRDNLASALDELGSRQMSDTAGQRNPDAAKVPELPDVATFCVRK